MRNYRHERNECSTVRNVQREETRRRARDTVVRFSRTVAAYERKHRQSSRMGRSHTSEIILSRERIFMLRENPNVLKSRVEESKLIVFNGKKILNEILSEISIKTLKILLGLRNIS